jgi:dTDP-4-dehydrorhamnose 3,5-epimerase
MIKIALYDQREESPTNGMLNEYFIGEKNPLLIRIPPMVFHGFKAIGGDTAYVINIPNRLYDREDPDEYRLPPDCKDIPYDWLLAKGKRHG